LDAAINIFVNGLSGVFFGMAVLYLTVKVIAVIAAPRSETEKKV
jgi:hypothetical protein